MGGPRPAQSGACAVDIRDEKRERAPQRTDAKRRKDLPPVHLEGRMLGVHGGGSWPQNLGGLRMNLRLVGSVELVTCPRCDGRGKVPCPETITANGDRARSGGFPMPCDLCNGRKWVESAERERYQALALRGMIEPKP